MAHVSNLDIILSPVSSTPILISIPFLILLPKYHYLSHYPYFGTEILEKTLIPLILLAIPIYCSLCYNWMILKCKIISCLPCLRFLNNYTYIALKMKTKIPETVTHVIWPLITSQVSPLTFAFPRIALHSIIFMQIPYSRRLLVISTHVIFPLPKYLPLLSSRSYSSFRSELKCHFLREAGSFLVLGTSSA